MKLEDIDVEKLALFVELEMERRLSWAANALYIAGRPPRATVRDEEAIDEDRGKSEAARAVRLLHAFAMSGACDVEEAPELALRFLWRWVYAPPFLSTSAADAAPLSLLRYGIEADEGAAPEEEQLVLLLQKSLWWTVARR